MADRRTQKTKTSIKDAIMDLILYEKLEDITITKITNKANIARKTFYLHYNSIEDVIYDIENDIYETLMNSLNKYISNKSYLIPNIFLDLNNIIIQEELLFKRIAISDSYSLFQNAFERVLDKLIQEIVEKVYNVISENTKYYSSFYAAGIIKIYMSFLRGDTNLTLEGVTQIATKACFLGIDQIMDAKK